MASAQTETRRGVQSHNKTRLSRTMFRANSTNTVYVCLSLASTLRKTRGQAWCERVEMGHKTR